MQPCKPLDVPKTQDGAHDELGQLIHNSLFEIVSEARPPDDMWTRISRQMTRRENALDCLRRKVRCGFPWVSLVQTAVFSSLLIGLFTGGEGRVTAPFSATPLAFGSQIASDGDRLADRSQSDSPTTSETADRPRRLVTGATVASAADYADSDREHQREANLAWKDVVLVD